ncbi:hypothetical protein RZS08_52335, partial [Arthrospira platensis SPKY1]|nr:hypothetical protein [Arthrospira platensis SPKY1]
VQAGERLVQQQRPWLGEQGPHQGHAGTLSAREGGRVAVAIPGQTGLVQRLLHPRPARGGRSRRHREQQVLPDAHVGEQQVVLEDQADAAPGRRPTGHVLAVEHDLALEVQRRLALGH